MNAGYFRQGFWKVRVRPVERSNGSAGFCEKNAGKRKFISPPSFAAFVFSIGSVLVHPMVALDFRNGRNARHVRRKALLGLLLGVMLYKAYAADTNKISEGNDAQFIATYRSNWGNGIGPGVTQQVPRADAITVVPMTEFYGMALKATINRSDDFKGVANGTPRAELAFEKLTRFAVGGDYEIRWSTMIPYRYEFDQKQPEIITQIHQSYRNGSPPFSLMLSGNRYQVDIRGLHAAKTITFGNTQNDSGKKVSWVLRYRPDDTGAQSVTDLYKDGVLVVQGGATENAYPNDKNSYLKIGIYKWYWQTRPTDVAVRTMYYGDIEVLSRKGSRVHNSSVEE